MRKSLNIIIMSNRYIISPHRFWKLRYYRWILDTFACSTWCMHVLEFITHYVSMSN